MRIGKNPSSPPVVAKVCRRGAGGRPPDRPACGFAPSTSGGRQGALRSVSFASTLAAIVPESSLTVAESPQPSDCRQRKSPLRAERLGTRRSPGPLRPAAIANGALVPWLHRQQGHSPARTRDAGRGRLSGCRHRCRRAWRAPPARLREAMGICRRWADKLRCRETSQLRWQVRQPSSDKKRSAPVMRLRRSALRSGVGGIGYCGALGGSDGLPLPGDERPSAERLHSVSISDSIP